MRQPTPPPIVAPPVVRRPQIQDNKMQDAKVQHPRRTSRLRNAPSPDERADQVARDVRIGIIRCSIAMLVVLPFLGNQSELPVDVSANRSNSYDSTTSSSFIAKSIVNAQIQDDDGWSTMIEHALLPADLHEPGGLDQLDETSFHVAGEKLVDLAAIEAAAVAIEAVESTPQAVEATPAVAQARSADELVVAPPSEAEPAESIDFKVPPTITWDEALSLPTETHAVCTTGSCINPGRTLGTSLVWADSPADAYRLAAEQDKLVFLIHVSGNFDIPGFT